MEKIDENEIRQFIKVTMEKIDENTRLPVDKHVIKPIQSISYKLS